MVDNLKKRAPRYDKPTRRGNAALHAIDALIFVVIFLVSAIVIASLAVAAPIALAVTALLGLLADKKDGKGWRAAGA